MFSFKIALGISSWFDLYLILVQTSSLENGNGSGSSLRNILQVGGKRLIQLYYNGSRYRVLI